MSEPRMTSAVVTAATAMTMAVALVAVASIAAQQPVDRVAFTAAQADTGQRLYATMCASCHGSTLEDGEFAPALRGARFRDRWAGHAVGELAEIVDRMPPTQPGVLQPSDRSALLAYLLRANGVAAGTTAIPSEVAALAQLLLPWQASAQQP